MRAGTWQTESTRHFVYENMTDPKDAPRKSLFRPAPASIVRCDVPDVLTDAMISKQGTHAMNQAIAKPFALRRRMLLTLMVAILAASQATGQDTPRGEGRGRGNRGNQPPSELAQKLIADLPMTPLTKDRDGDFHIGPPYVDDPAFTVKEGVPKGKVVRFVMNSADSKIFPTAPPPRRGRGRGRGQRAGERGAGERGATEQPVAEQPAGEQAPPQPVTFERPVAVYIPAGYEPGTPTPFIVVMDGVRGFTKADPPDPSSRNAFVPEMLDNLIHEKRVPSMVAILIDPGPGGQRTIEYDTVSDRYTMFIENEVLPKISRDYNITFTKDPEGRAAMGESSGAACALSMAWFHPELYRRVLTYSGTFVRLGQRNETAPNGAWDYHTTLIPNSEKKPLRIWLHVGDRDNGASSPEEDMRNWVTAQFHMARVLKEKGYPYQFVLADNSGHVDNDVERQTLPTAFEWVWTGYKPSGQ
jgi:enterochelin esterase-like enzyme